MKSMNVFRSVPRIAYSSCMNNGGLLSLQSPIVKCVPSRPKRLKAPFDLASPVALGFL